MQPRFNHTHGRRAKSLMAERRFRAAYDFLLLRAEEDASLKGLCEHWTKAQIGVKMNSGQKEPFKRSSRKPRRRRRRKPSAAKAS